MKGVVMKCKEICELMPDLAAGLDAVTPEVKDHLESWVKSRSGEASICASGMSATRRLLTCR